MALRIEIVEFETCKEMQEQRGQCILGKRSAIVAAHTVTLKLWFEDISSAGLSIKIKGQFLGSQGRFAS